MNFEHNPRLSHNSRTLRKNMTKEEKRLWYDFFKYVPITVHRQKVLEEYIVDFYIAKGKVVVELDGSQHADGEQKKKDDFRDMILRSKGYCVLRFSNAEVLKSFPRVCASIMEKIPGNEEYGEDIISLILSKKTISK